MRGGAVHGACQSEAAVHPDSECRQRRSGFPACSEHMQRGNHLRPLRRAARPASGTTEPAGQLCQYLYHSRNCVCISSVWKFGWINERQHEHDKHKAKASSSPCLWGIIAHKPVLRPHFRMDLFSNTYAQILFYLVTFTLLTRLQVHRWRRFPLFLN